MGEAGVQRSLFPPAEDKASGRPGRDRKLTVSLPLSVLRELKARTVAEDTTVRALLLDALKSAGYAVPEAEIRDRRRRGEEAA
jgi:hypothetical protein